MLSAWALGVEPSLLIQKKKPLPQIHVDVWQKLT